jgi:hypothetical protein
MSRRSSCTGPHEWEASPRHPFRQNCRNCPVTFPCREECAHGDCEDVKGDAPRCYVCRKRVPGFENGFHDTRHGKLVRIHQGECAEKYEATKGSESETEEEAAA